MQKQVYYFVIYFVEEKTQPRQTLLKDNVEKHQKNQSMTAQFLFDHKLRSL